MPALVRGGYLTYLNFDRKREDRSEAGRWLVFAVGRRAATMKF